MYTVYMHAYIYIYIHIHIHTHTHKQRCIYVCICTHTFTEEPRFQGENELNHAMQREEASKSLLRRRMRGMLLARRAPADAEFGVQLACPGFAKSGAGRVQGYGLWGHAGADTGAQPPWFACLRQYWHCRVGCLFCAGRCSVRRPVAAAGWIFNELFLA